MEKCSTTVLSGAELQRHKARDALILIKYRQDDCSACENLAPVFEGLCREWRTALGDRVEFLDVDASRAPTLAAHLEALPRVEAHHRGRLIDTLRTVLSAKDSKAVFQQGVEDARKASQKEGKPVLPEDVRASIDRRAQTLMAASLNRTITRLATRLLKYTGAVPSAGAATAA